VRGGTKSPRASWAAWAVAALVAAAGVGRARAETVYAVIPSLTLGITDNARAAPSSTGMNEGDGFGTATLLGSGRYEGAHGVHTLSAFAAYTRFLEGHGIDTATGGLGWASLLHLTSTLDLTLGAGIGIARTGGVNAGDLTTVTPQGTKAGSAMFVNATASQGLLYKPSARSTYSESLAVQQVRYLDAPDLPTTTIIVGGGRATRLYGLNAFFLDLHVADTYTPIDPLLSAGRFAEGHTFFASLEAGWERDLTPTWSTELMAGPVALFKLEGPAVIAPAGAASLRYRRLPWFATLTVTQTPAPDIFLSEATISDMVMARVALPLSRSETFFVTGFAGYIYARIANNQGSLQRAFDQRTAGVALAARSHTLPLAGSLQYLIVDQHGSSQAGRVVPDFEQQMVLLTVSGVFRLGPGTPPLFSGTP